MEKLLLSKKFWLVIGVFLYVSLFFFRQTNLAASDLGRHIKNGEVIVSTGTVFHTNLYSYTFPEFSAPNHHWLFGVISYWVWQVAGFDGLSLMSALLYIAAIVVVFYYSAKRTAIISSLIAVLLALPLLADRSETRPEAFSLLFFSLFFCFGSILVEQKKIRQLPLIALAAGLLMALWVNIHIFFVLTGVIALAAVIHILCNFTAPIVRNGGIVLISIIVGAFINPLGLGLLLYPLKIFNNYGYKVSENQNLWFFLHLFTRPIHWYLLFFMILTLVLSLYYVRKNIKRHLYHLISISFFIIFTFKMIRMENILAISAIPLLSASVHSFWISNETKIRKIFHQPIMLMVSSLVGFAVLCVGAVSGLFFPFSPDFGVGLLPQYDKSIEAMKFLSPQFYGPMFNNFDSGSFLIFSIYPTQKVFVDNRAEAYPDEFLQNIYVKAQEDETVWSEIDQRYQFGSIVYYRHDNTNWGQEFLVKRFQDPQWVPIYVDNYLIVFIKEIPEHQELIKKYRLPAEMFSVKES